jgi:hypothetical protein
VKNGIRLVIMSASFGLIAGCAVATAPGYVGPAEQPTSLTLTRQQYRGFSVKPPTSLGWTVRVTEQSPLQATYRRSLPTKTHTFVAAVSLIQLDKNLAIEEALVPHGLSDSERVRSLENSHQPDTSRKATCIRYSIHYQDLKAANFARCRTGINRSGIRLRPSYDAWTSGPRILLRAWAAGRIRSGAMV